MAQAGACGRDAGVARRAGHVARVLRCAGCHGLRKVCERALAKMRGLAGKESGVFGRDAWQGRSRAGEEAGGATGCGGLRAWGRAGLAQAARDAGHATGLTNPRIEKSHVLPHWRTKFAGYFSPSSKY